LTAFVKTITETLATSDILHRGGGSYVSGILAKSPTAYWRLGDLSGTTATDSVGVYPGTYTGTFTLGQQNALAEPGASTFFHGSSASVNIPWNSALATSHFTIEGWINPIAVIQQVLFNFADGALDKGFYFTYVSGGSFQLVMLGGAGLTLNTGTLAVADWQQVAVTYDGATAAIYFNGTQVASSAYTGYVPSDGSGGALGMISLASFDDPPYFKGYMQEVSLFNYALTPAQIATDYTNRSGAGGLNNSHRTLTEAAVASDAVTRQLNIIRPISETHTGSDSAARQYRAVRNPAENLTTGDTSARRAGFVQPIAETLVTDDEPTRIYGAIRAASEAHTTSDSLVKHYQALRPITETHVTAESLARLFHGQRVSAEHLTTADSIARGAVHLARAFTESLAHGETLTRRITVFRSIGESHATADSVSRGAHAARAFIETYRATESFQRLVHASRTVTAEHLTESDAITLAHHVINRGVAEHLTTSDAVTQVVVALAIMGYIIVDPATGNVVANLPDWGYVLVEDPIAGNKLYEAPLQPHLVTPVRTK
jgi:hypothetical protein